MIARPLQCLSKPFQRFAGNSVGTAAIEFAYLLPVLVLATFGTFEVARGVLMHKRFQRAAAMVSDLVAREDQIGTSASDANAELDGIMTSAKHVMSPFSTSSLKVGITSIMAKSTDANNTKVQWSYSYQGKSVSAQCASKSMPASGMIAQGNAAILVESEYTYTPYLANLVPGFAANILWTDTITNMPRKKLCVSYGSADCTLTCPGW